MEYATLLHDPGLHLHDSEPRIPPVSKKVKSKNALVHFPDDCPITRREPATNIRAVIKIFRTQARTFGRRARQRHTKTSRNQEARRNAARGTRRCGGGTKRPPPACKPLPRPSPRPMSAFESPPSTLWAWTSLPAATLSPLRHPTFPNTRAQNRR